MIAHPAHYKPWRPVVTTSFGLLFMIIAVIYYWAAYRPKVGPVGAGPNDTEIWSGFLYMMIAGGLFFTLGLVGWAVIKGRESKNNSGAESQ
ncbi:hypothetical protein GCM10023310_15440 [Paenibacillus vulneris]|uniref:Uncharacterized protein n=1 Tax=Paenibacillus vulneris TaxID=1133364 RepID=A0ABW3UI83_9BACL